jgi:small subunit ribosomal protein S1
MLARPPKGGEQADNGGFRALTAAIRTNRPGGGRKGGAGNTIPPSYALKETTLSSHSPDLKEKFRKDADPELDARIDEALEGVPLEDLYNTDRAQPGNGGAQMVGGKQIRKGRVVSIGKDDVFVDFGGKSQGVAPIMQFDEIPEPGTEMDFVVERYDTEEGVLILSKRGASASGVTWETLEVGQTVEAVVTGTNKGGLELEVKGMRAFMPAGQVEMFHVPSFDDYIGRKFSCEVTAFSRESKNIVLSRRNILEREREETKKTLLAELGEGQIRRGTIRQVMDFGAFVDLGGVDGLLHVSEMSFRRGFKPSELVKSGDVVDVKIIRIDRETGKLSLSLKQARGTDPWADAAERYAVGSSVTGRVTKIEPFGCFIEVEEGIEGLLPISEMSYQRIRHATDLCKVGDTLKLVVLTQDTVGRRMSFSLKQAGPDPWKTAKERYWVDGIVEGKVTRVVDFGAFVELEPGLEGLVHVSELADKRVRTPSDIVQPGQDVKVRIVEIDPDSRRIGLSLRRVVDRKADLAPAGTAPAAAKPAAPRPKIQLKGGLDFEFKKNK